MRFDLETGEAVASDAGEGAFNVVFAGDLCPRGRAEKLVLEGKSAEMLSSVMPDLRAADISVVNLETPLTAAETPIWKSGPNIKVDPGCVELVRAGGWDAVCCANNHIGDYGPGPVTETLDLLAHNNIGAFGAGENLAAAEKPLIIEKNGVKTALLGLAENEFGCASPDKAGASPLRPLRNIAQIRAAADVADITIVMIHGGNEYNPIPSPRVVETYRAFAEAGASAVIGCHTHCPQGAELWKGVPIVYSLGNFLFDDFGGEHQGYNWWFGFMVEIGFAEGRAARVRVIPHQCRPPDFRVESLRGKEREAFIEYLNFISKIPGDSGELQKYFDAWCASSAGGYFSRLGTPFHPADWSSPESIRRFMAMRNLHTCEAHCELITNTLRIFEERREERAAEWLPRLRKLCEGSVPAV